MTKGRQIAVDGRLQVRSYDGKDGQKHWVTEVIANTVEYLGNSNNGGNSNAQQEQGQAQYQGNNQQNYNNQKQGYNNGGYQQQPQQGQMYGQNNGGFQQPQYNGDNGFQQQNGANFGLGDDFGTEVTFDDDDLPF